MIYPPLAGITLIRHELVPDRLALFTVGSKVVGFVDLNTGKVSGERSATMMVSPATHAEIIRAAEADSGLKVT